MKEIVDSFVRSVRPACPNCNTGSLINELYNQEDGSKTTVCAYCHSNVRIKIVPKDNGIHIQTTELME